MKRLIVLVISFFLVGGYYLFQLKSNTPENKVINLAIDNKIKSFDPAVAFNNDSLLVLGQSLETLFQYHYLKRPFEVIPLLADGMPEISTDGLKYKFKIKRNIKYHNHKKTFEKDRYVKAQDFVWQIKRLAFKPIKSTGTWLFADKLKGFNEFSDKVGSSFEAFMKEELIGLKVINDYEFEIELIKPEPNLLYFLAMPFTSPVPVEVIKKYKNELKEVIIGTGPYKFEKFDGEKYEFSKFDGFHFEEYPTSGDRYANTKKLLVNSKQKLPFIKNINFKIVPDETDQWSMFKKGELDVLDIPKKYLSEISKPDSALNKELQKLKIEVKHFSRQTTRWLGFNMNDPIIGKNQNLRKAIAHAIDYDKYIEIVTNNTNLRANSIFNPSIPGYKPSHRIGYEFNLDKAKEYLAKSGIKPGELTLTYSTRGKKEIHFEESQFIQAQLARLGITIKVQVLEFSEFLKKGRAGKLQFWTDNWIYDYPDAENILQLLIGQNHPGINKSGYANKKVDELYIELSKTLDPEKRFRIMYQIEDIVENELPWIMLMYESTYIAHHGSVKNFRKSFFIRNFIKYLQKY
jgi:ABC-type transport system substrate-binding protein